MAIELVVCVESWASNSGGELIGVAKGMTFPSDHRLVKRCPDRYVPVSGGEPAIAKRLGELWQAQMDREAKTAADNAAFLKAEEEREQKLARENGFRIPTR